MSLRTTHLADDSNCNHAGVCVLLRSGWIEQSNNAPFVCERDILILLDEMLPHRLDVWRKDKCKVLVGVALTNNGKTAVARKLRSIIDTQKLHAEIAGPDNYWVKVDLLAGTRFNSFLNSSVLFIMDAKNIQYELIDSGVVHANLRSRQVKEWWRRAIRKQIKLNQDSRMARAHNEVIRRKRVFRHEQQGSRIL